MMDHYEMSEILIILNKISFSTLSCINQSNSSVDSAATRSSTRLKSIYIYNVTYPWFISISNEKEFLRDARKLVHDDDNEYINAWKARE